MLASSIEFMTVQHRVSKSRGQQLTRIASKRKSFVDNKHPSYPYRLRYSARDIPDR